MEQYKILLKDIIDNGVWKEPAREGMPRTKEVFCRTMRFDLSKGFPLLTTKKMFTKGIVAELLWFLRGDTNIRFLINNNCNIWNQDAYKYYLHKCEDAKVPPTSYKQWLEIVKSDFNKHPSIGTYTYGDCGEIYGSQWNNFNGWFNQINPLIKNIKNKPNSRYHIVTAWNPCVFLGPKERAALPACHMMFQCSVRDGKLDMMMLQRSCDTFLGVPFNIASYALLCHIIAKKTGLEVGEFVWVGNSVHLYENHIMCVEEQLKRSPFPLCKLEFPLKEFMDYEVSDFIFKDYKSYPAIKAELSVGK